ncbi:MAG: hypothetical protein ABI572_12545 [Actinomycetota bacterium]
MTPRDAALAVLRASEGPLHWTVVLDRALRSGHLDPFSTPDVRGAMLAGLRELAASGEIARVEKGVFAQKPARDTEGNA